MAVARRGGRCAGLLLLLASAALQMAATALPAQDVPDEPSMPEAPEQFRVGLTLSRFDWREEAGADAVEDGSIYGAEVETLVHPFVSFRFGVAFGQPEVRSSTDRASTDEYVVELLADLRLPVAPLGRQGVVPFLTGGYGSVVHVPDQRDDLITRNQSAYVWGAGLEVEALSRVAMRGEWRRARVALNDLFDPENRVATQRRVDRWMLGVFWRF
ncbi:MAG TPA: outer membrane beta-barrel protein [Longimicrobiales bacterium]|nr:outer membrane beta-barrel protein [Longimicrobiales bacterium]